MFMSLPDIPVIVMIHICQLLIFNSLGMKKVWLHMNRSLYLICIKVVKKEMVTDLY